MAAPPQARRLPLLVAALLLGTLAAGLASPLDAITGHPLLCVALIVFTVAVDAMRIDIFDRSNVSPASVPIFAMAFLFGPVGPIAAELVLAAVRAARREAPIKLLFDLGALGLSGSAAAAVYRALGPTTPTAKVLCALPAALTAYAIASALVSVVMWFVRGERPFAAWREQFAWLWAHYLAFGALAAVMVGVEQRLGPRSLLIFAIPTLILWITEEQYLRRTRESVRLLRERNGELEAANTRIAKLLEQAHEGTLMTLATLGRAIHAADPRRAGSTERVARIARLVGERMGLGEDDVHALTMGAVVHDIGSVGVPADQLESPACGELSAHILAPLRLPRAVTDMALHHRTRYDSAPDIPLAARILAVARAFDRDTADTSIHAYDSAVHHLQMTAGTRYCPEVVSALMTCLDDDPALQRYFGAGKVATHA